MKSFTLAMLERHVDKKQVQAALRRSMLAEGGAYSEFVDQLYIDIDESIYDLQSSPNLRQNDNEDRITYDILLSLRKYGYQASHDTNTGGHVDLSVRLGEHSWIAEAKKDGGFEEGLRQLTTRYVQASGNFGHDHAGLLFYFVKTKNSRGVLDAWRRKMIEAGQPCSDCEKNELAFYSNHILCGSGTNLRVRTMVVSLYHQPLDKSARAAAKRKVAEQKPR